MPGARAQNAGPLGRTNRAIPGDAATALASLVLACQASDVVVDVTMRDEGRGGEVGGPAPRSHDGSAAATAGGPSAAAGRSGSTVPPGPAPERRRSSGDRGRQAPRAAAGSPVHGPHGTTGTRAASTGAPGPAEAPDAANQAGPGRLPALAEAATAPGAEPSARPAGGTGGDSSEQRRERGTEGSTCEATVGAEPGAAGGGAPPRGPEDGQDTDGARPHAGGDRVEDEGERASARPDGRTADPVPAEAGEGAEGPAVATSAGAVVPSDRDAAGSPSAGDDPAFPANDHRTGRNSNRRRESRRGCGFPRRRLGPGRRSPSGPCDSRARSANRRARGARPAWRG